MDTHDHERKQHEGGSLLGAIPRTDPFVVPDSYFEQLPHAVQARIAARGQRSPMHLAWRRWAVALPVVVAIGVGSFLLFHDGGRDVRPAPVAATVTPLTDAELDQMDVSDLFAATDENDLPELGTTVDVQLTDDELLAYLDREHADLTELLEQP